MILYEFVCQDCQKEFEELVRNDTDEVKCPYCASLRVRRLISAVRGRSGSGADLASLDSAAAGCSPGAGFS